MENIAPPLTREMMDKMAKDYLYLTFPEPMKGITFKVGCPVPGTIFTDLDYQDEEEIEQEPTTIEFSL